MESRGDGRRAQKPGSPCASHWAAGNPQPAGIVDARIHLEHLVTNDVSGGASPRLPREVRRCGTGGESDGAGARPVLGVHSTPWPTPAAGATGRSDVLEEAFQAGSVTGVTGVPGKLSHLSHKTFPQLRTRANPSQPL